MDEYESYEGKNVKVFLTNGFIYTLKDLEVFENSLKGVDKFGEEIILSKSSITSIASVSGTQPVLEK